VNKTATFVKQLNGRGDGRVYRVDPPMVTDDGDTTEYVWVSAAVAPYTGPETYIFACDHDGNVTDWMELPGSFRGGLDHREALACAGYDIAEVPA
jgi:hypothetical protein